MRNIISNLAERLPCRIFWPYCMSKSRWRDSPMVFWRIKRYGSLFTSVYRGSDAYGIATFLRIQRKQASDRMVRVQGVRTRCVSDQCRARAARPNRSGLRLKKLACDHNTCETGGQGTGNFAGEQ
jgi:hypothetical protein